MDNSKILKRIANKIGIDYNYINDLVVVVYDNQMTRSYKSQHEHIEFHTVDAIVYKNLAIHITYGYDGQRPGDYTVSHVDSGMTVGKTALAFAEITQLDRDWFEEMHERAVASWESFSSFDRDKIYG